MRRFCLKLTEPDREIGPYKIVNRLGKGGMGEVFLAQDRRLGRLVALKTLPSYFVSDDERLRRFQTEARAASALNHPNILTIYEVGESDGTHFIAAEYIEGHTLRELISAGDLTLGRSFGNYCGVAFWFVGGARGGNYSPRHQAREHHAARRWVDQNPRLRHRQVDGSAVGRNDGVIRAQPDADRRADGNDRLRVA